MQGWTPDFIPKYVRCNAPSPLRVISRSTSLISASSDSCPPPPTRLRCVAFRVCEDGLNLNIMDELVPVTGDESVQCSLKLAATNGIFTGISGGGSIAAALKGALAPYAAPVACARACLRLTLALARTKL